MSGLTDTQRRILEFLRTFLTGHGYPPTRKEIAERFEFDSHSAADGHLRALEKKGYIAIAPGVSRGIRIVKESQ